MYIYVYRPTRVAHPSIHTYIYIYLCIYIYIYMLHSCIYMYTGQLESHTLLYPRHPSFMDKDGFLISQSKMEVNIFMFVLIRKADALGIYLHNDVKVHVNITCIYIYISARTIYIYTYALSIYIFMLPYICILIFVSIVILNTSFICQVAKREGPSAAKGFIALAQSCNSFTSHDKGELTFAMDKVYTSDFYRSTNELAANLYKEVMSLVSLYISAHVVPTEMDIYSFKLDVVMKKSVIAFLLCVFSLV